MKFVIQFVVFFSVCFSLKSQTITLKGTCYNLNKGITKIYYAGLHQKFNAKQCFVLDAKKHYTFSINKTQMQNLKAEDIIFSADINADQRDLNKHNLVIHLQEIFNDEIFTNQPLISLKSDLDFTEELRISEEGDNAERQGVGHLVGDYLFIHGKDSVNLSLTSSYLKVDGNINNKNYPYCNEAKGFWYLWKEDGHLYFHVDYINTTWNIRQHQDDSFGFKPVNNEFVPAKKGTLFTKR